MRNINEFQKENYEKSDKGNSFHTLFQYENAVSLYLRERAENNDPVKCLDLGQIVRKPDRA